MFIKLQKEFTSNIWPVGSVTLEKLFLVPMSPPSGPFEPVHLNFIQLTLRMGCQYVLVSMYVSWMGWSLPLPQGWCPHGSKEIVRTHLSPLGCFFHNCQWSRHPLHWTNHLSFSKNFANVIIITILIALHHQGISKEWIKKLDSSRTRMNNMKHERTDKYNFHFYDFVFQILLVF